MPLLKLQTNQAIPESRQSALLQQASGLVASLLGKPERYVMVILEADCAMIFAGNDEPAAYLELKSLGLPQQKTAELSAALCQFISETCGVPANRIYIEFRDAERHLWGWDGGTF